MNSAKRLRSLIEDYQDIPVKFQPVFNYISLEELRRIKEKRVGQDSENLYRRLLKAAEYWYHRDFPKAKHIDAYRLNMLANLESGSMPKLVSRRAMMIAHIMLEEMGEVTFDGFS